MNIFSDKKIIVSGASRGIGLATVELLLEAGAEVIGLSRTKMPERDSFVSFECDVTDSSAIDAVCNYVGQRWGEFHGLVNCAGITSRISSDKGHSESVFLQTIDVNLVGTWRLCDRLFPLGSESGSIVNIASIGAHLGFPDNPSYVASKAGVIGLTKALAIDFWGKKIRVNSISPGYVLTDMTSGSYSNPEQKAARERRSIMNRYAAPDEIAKVVLFLLSDNSSFMTGSDIVVDGGWSAKGL